MKKFTWILSAIFLSIALTGTAFGFSITADDIINNAVGNQSVLSGIGTVTSSPRDLDTKTLGGFKGVGVAGGFVGGEIDLKGEAIRFDFDNPTIIDEIQIGFLFTEGNYGDTVSELARIQYADNPWQAIDLSTTSNNAATVSGPGTVTNISLGDNTGAGVWSISNPFGDQAVEFLQFTALQNTYGGAGKGSFNSDFSIVSVTSAPVPEPGTIALLGLGLMGLAAYRRKSQMK